MRITQQFLKIQGLSPDAEYLADKLVGRGFGRFLQRNAPPTGYVASVTSNRSQMGGHCGARDR